MKHVTVMLVPVVMAALELAAPRLASACGPLAIEADPRVLARWPDLPERVRSTFDHREDIDACARVKVALRARFHVEVTLPDGRVAERVVPHVEDVVPVLEALLVVPASKEIGASEADVAAPPSSEPPPVAPSPPAFVPPREAKPAAPDGAPERDTSGDERPRKGRRPVGIELSALAGARTGGGPVGLGAGLLGFADVSGWLVGLGGRADHYASVDVSMTAFTLAALGGHRFRWGDDTAIDLVAGPALLVLDSGEARERVRANGPQPPRTEEPLGSVRIVTGARLHFRMRSSFRTFVGVDGELGPSAVGPPSHGLPVATIGVALGATVGAR